MKMWALGLLLAVIPTSASATWREARSAHFTIYSEDDAKTVTEYADKLERFDSALRWMRKVEDRTISPANRVTIFVVRDPRSLRRLLGGDNSWVAGFYRPRAAASMIVTPSLRFADSGDKNQLNAQTVLLHEYTHHFMLENFAGAYPMWFAEGFAEFNSTARFESDGAVMIGAAAQHRAASLSRPNNLTVEQLLTADSRKLDDRARASVYAMGWLLTHYLTFSDARSGQLGRYIRSINEGTAPLKAATDVFGDLDRLDREVDGYLLRRKLLALRVPPAELKIGKIEVRDLPPGANAVLPLRMRLKRGVTPPEYAEFVALARTAAQPYPNDPDAQLLLADAEAMVRQREASDAAIARALASDPDSIEGLLARARSLMRNGPGTAGAGGVREIRAAIGRANRAEPDHPLPLMLYFDSFAAAKEKPPELAVDGLFRAVKVAPQDAGLRMRLANHLIVDSRYDEARTVLAPVAYAPHGGPIVDRARAMIEAIPARGESATAPAAP